MSLIGDIGDLTKDEATAKRIIDYASATFGAMLDEKIDRIEKLIGPQSLEAYLDSRRVVLTLEAKEKP